MRKEKIKKLAVIAAFGLLFAAIITTYGCDGGKNPAGPSSDSSCEGFAGGNEIGKWARRGSDEVREYTGTIRRIWFGGTLEWEVPYKKPQHNKITTEHDGRTYYNCFEVNGDVMRMDVATFDRIR